MAPGLTGYGTGREGGLQKLTIQYEKERERDFAGEMQALFNPTELAFTYTVGYHLEPRAADGEQPPSQEQVFDCLSPRTLSLDLFFDTYSPSDPNRPASVVSYTDELGELARVNVELHRPPVCRLQWGRFRILEGVLTELKQTFTMFLADGTPVRAAVACTFAEHVTDEQAGRWRELHSADVYRSYVVRRGDTLHNIAGRHYGDPSRWRPIARANKVLNPRHLSPGMVLRIPRLER